MKLIARTGQEILVDDDVGPHITGKTWNVVTARHVQYARFSRTYMHRVVINAPLGILVDHINGNGLDNRKENLRLVTHQGNKANSHHGVYSSVFVGVSLDAHRKSTPWRVLVKRNGKVAQLGRFSNEIDAARCYDEFVIRAHGNLAVTNFPPLYET